MRLMSFSLTTPQILSRQKTVTRRMGWTFLKPGDLVQAVEKGMGLKKGEKVRRLAVLRVVDVRIEPLSRLLPERGRGYLQPRQPMEMAYAFRELEREGFRHLTRQQFVSMFCKSHKGCTPDTEVTRIEFEYVESGS